MRIKRIGWLSVLLAAVTATGAYWLSDYFQSLLLSLMSVFLGFGIALLIVNVFMQEEEKKEAAAMLLSMIHEKIVANNHLFNDKGADKFGIPIWHSIIEVMNENRRNPDALTPEQRDKIIEIINSNQSELTDIYSSIEQQFREISYILGWSFSPKLVRDCMSTRMEIAEFNTLVLLDNPTEEQKKELIKRYFDIEADASAVLVLLANILEIEIQKG